MRPGRVLTATVLGLLGVCWTRFARADTNDGAGLFALPGIHRVIADDPGAPRPAMHEQTAEEVVGRQLFPSLLRLSATLFHLRNLGLTAVPHGLRGLELRVEGVL